MPPRVNSLGFKLTARPDRVDFRDRSYAPPLKSLPPVWPPREVIKRNLNSYEPYILNQGQTSCCTGFGLAAVINFIYWSKERERQLQSSGKAIRRTAKFPKVSPFMLYHNARLYDEWEGSDYDGSSCRGAMKGWHKHGVCSEKLWDPTAKMQKSNWPEDAAKRPLGAYYRVDAKSIADMQAAIYEVHSIYCMADTHEGWTKPSQTATLDGIKLAQIGMHDESEGGHAFAIVGYTDTGFVVQNSWGKKWGTGGFALLTYQDWIKNGWDAWVAAIGAPMRIESSITTTRGNLLSNAMAQQITAPAHIARGGKASAGSAELWPEERAFRHSIVLGNDGKLLQRIVGASDPDAALAHVLGNEIKDQRHAHLALYVHGGLNSEEAAIVRVRRLGPWFVKNGIHPIFLIWRTGLMDSLNAIAEDEIKQYEEQVRSLRARGLGDVINSAIDKLKEVKDRAFEVAAEKLIGKAVWTQMKQNASMAARGSNPVLAKMVKHLAGAHKPVHLLGHSAGSIMIGHLLDVADGLKFSSCDLYAPACTLAFAAEKYGTAMAHGGPMQSANLHVDYLADSAETADSVGPYGKSLLYLVSRALEDFHKMPILGLELALKPKVQNKIPPSMELAQPQTGQDLGVWKNKVMSTGRVTLARHSGPKIHTSKTETIQIAHGSFDNDIEVVNASLTRILGHAPTVPIIDLTGF